MGGGGAYFRPHDLTLKRQTAKLLGMTDTITPTADAPVAIASPLVAALENAWGAIRANHPELPAVFVIIGSGDEGKQMRWGHFWALRWQRGEDVLHELFIGGEGLKRPAGEVLTTMVHEAAHCLAHVRGIKDTSRGGRYHNKRFAALARELGIEPELDTRIGWSPCKMPEVTADRYRETLDALTAALDVYRHNNVAAGSTSKSRNLAPARCGCDVPRKIRVSASVLAEAPILCGACEVAFAIPDNDV